MTAPSLASIELIHARVPGRARYAIASLLRRHSLARALERGLHRLPFVRARASAASGTLLVLFDPETPREAIETAIARVLAAPDEPAEPEPAPARARDGAPLRPAHDASPATAFHALVLQELLGQLRATRDGLDSAEARARLDSDGPNSLSPPPRRSELEILLDQFASTPVAMLGASAVLSGATGGVGDALAILGVLGINAAIGYATESGAERTISSLTQAPQQQVNVLRDAEVRAVAIEQIVTGDVLSLAAGTFVPADARLLEAQDLTVDESALTGESMPVGKTPDAELDEHAPLATRSNMVYRGTLITGGSARALVVATGARTEVGRIQGMANALEQRSTPMQRQLDRLGRELALVAGCSCLATMGVGLLRGQAFLPMLRTAISLGVAAVPEGLPTVAITTLALGLSRMREERVIVRQLAAVETLGSVQVLCVDKTGTLTQNRMAVVALQAGLTRFSVRVGGVVDERGERLSELGPDLTQLVRLAALCNEVEIDQDHGASMLRGSATECALVQLALDAGVDVSELRGQYPIVSTQRRAERRNYMSTLHDGADGQLLAVKGRPSEVLGLCSRYFRDARVEELTDAERATIENDNERMAGRALRVLGVAYADRPQRRVRDGEPLPELVWVGLVGMEDPARPEVFDVLRGLRRAGIRTVMITGDQSGTAQAVAKQIGLSDNGHVEIIDSTRLDRIAPELLSSLAQRAHVFSRVSPAHKLQIVQALQKAGRVVAMTGDGINDGPALKAADIGVAMGASGTVVAREVADIVLEDDQLQSLVLAIEQGRAIYDDIRKAVHFILATNLTEILYTFSCVAAGLGEPLTPMQLLWINLLTDIFPELALAVQPAEADLLARPPRDPGRPMFVTRDFTRIVAEGTLLTLGSLTAYGWAARTSGPGPRASSVGFTTLTLAQLLHSMSARSEHHTIFDRERLAHNVWLTAAVSGTALLQICASFVPGLRTLLGTVPLRAPDWGVALAAAVLPFLCNETLKVALRHEPTAEHRSPAGPSLATAE